jgi:hypothetical protein
MAGASPLNRVRGIQIRRKPLTRRTPMMNKPTKIKDFPGRAVDAHFKVTGLLPSEVPTADTPAALRWWARQCANYGGLERAFNEAAAALEKALRH